MLNENFKFDKATVLLYNFHRGDKEWPKFNKLNRRERDHWRALTQVALNDPHSILNYSILSVQYYGYSKRTKTN